MALPSSGGVGPGACRAALERATQGSSARYTRYRGCRYLIYLRHIYSVWQNRYIYSYRILAYRSSSQTPLNLTPHTLGQSPPPIHLQTLEHHTHPTRFCSIIPCNTHTPPHKDDDDTKGTQPYTYNSSQLGLDGPSTHPIHTATTPHKGVMHR